MNDEPLEDVLLAEIAVLEKEIQDLQEQVRVNGINLDTHLEAAALVEQELKARAEKAEAERDALAEECAFTERIWGLPDNEEKCKSSWWIALAKEKALKSGEEV